MFEKKDIWIAEIFGTFGLVFIGCGAIVVNDIYGGVVSHLGIAFAFGFVVLAMIYSVGNVSGAHLNPAVTIGFFFSKRLKPSLILPYIISQIIGACLAIGLLVLLFPDYTGNWGATVPSGTLIQSFIGETIFTFILMFVILNVSTGHQEKGIMAGVAVGFTVFLLALVGGPITGASMNPVRSFAPALFALDLQYMWIYTLAPILGVLLAAPTCKWIQQDKCCKPEE